jgi:hypothetical protein
MFGRFALVVVLLSTPMAAHAADPEKDVRKKEAAKQLAKLPEYCKERRVTHVVELLAEWGEFAGEAEHEAVMGMALAIAEEGKAEAKALGKSGGWVLVPQLKFRGVSPTAEVKNLRTAASSYFVDKFVSLNRGAGNNDNYPREHLIVAATAFKARPNERADNCVILTNAPLAELEATDACLVVASGNLASNHGLYHSTVVCRGDAEYMAYEEESSLIKAGGKLTDRLAVQTKAAWKPDPKRAFPGDTKLLGVKFYAVAEDGLAVSERKERVTVSKVDESKPFGKGGVKAGDVIEQVDGVQVDTLHDLDRLVCRATVASGTARLKVKRGESTEVIEVKLADW